MPEKQSKQKNSAEYEKRVLVFFSESYFKS